MYIKKHMLVIVDYVLSDSEGRVIASSQDGQSMTYIHGGEQIVPGLERALEGHTVGERIDVVVEPKHGYGERQENRRLELSAAELPEGFTPEVGMQLLADDPQGNTVPLWVVEVENDRYVLDGNHPLAGITLHFDITVKQVRPATEAELEALQTQGQDE